MKLTNLNLHDKRSYVCIIAPPTLASLPYSGQVTRVYYCKIVFYGQKGVDENMVVLGPVKEMWGTQLRKFSN